MSRIAKGILLLLWLLALAALGLGLARKLEVNTDLRSFMPPPRNADQKLLMEGIGEGPGSRLLMLGIGGAPVPVLADLSRGLVAALQTDAQFTQITNGAFDLGALDEDLLAYRYLLSPTLDTQTFDVAWLRAELLDRLQDLSSPAASLFKPLLPRDPTLETLALATRWTPAQAPALRDGVWFSSSDCTEPAVCADPEALLLVQTRAGGFDPGEQEQAIDALQNTFRSLPGADQAQLVISGPGYFSVEVSQRTRAEAQWFGCFDTIGFALLLLLAYRSVTSLGLVALIVASAALSGIAALALVFGHAHGITLAFGFTLLGVVQEYPIRVLSHRRKAVSALNGVRELWPLLLTAIASACIAYLAFFASGVEGLQQLAVFTISGLAVAGVCTRYLLPHLLPLRFKDAADTPGMAAAWRGLCRIPRPRWLPALVLAVAAVLLWTAPPPFWQNNLAALTPVPQDLLQRDAQLRAELGAADVRYLLVLQAPSADAVLALSESIEVEVAALVAAGAVDAVELPSRYLPSIATQRARQAKLPHRDVLTAMLDKAAAEMPFREDLFAPFVEDVQTARQLEPLTPQRFAQTPLGQRLEAMLLERGGTWLGLGTLSGLHDPAAFTALAQAHPDQVRLLDLKAASESLVIDYRQRILFALAGAFVLLALTVVLAFRNLRRAWHVLAPMTLATILMIAVERAMGIPLSLFHLVAITLAAGLGLHYALFFERHVEDEREARRTLHATLVCVLSALLVFGLLAFSSLPVLRAIGLTVSLGVAFHFCLSLSMAREREQDHAGQV